MNYKSDLLKTLDERGFIYGIIEPAALDELAATSSINAYIGFDCTASSLHVGSLIQLQVLRWLHKLGHKPVCLLGYATTQIGDPTGKDAARPMLTDDEIHRNLQGIKRTVHKIVPHAKIIKNDRWFNAMWSFVHVLRKFGPRFSINNMLTMDVFARRLAENRHLSFLEFCYPIMQAVDFYELNQSRDNVVLQIGGSDQWANILGGIELIRKETEGKGVAFGITTPLLTDSAGNKMGKTAGGQTIWLDPTMTSPWDFWQFWRNVEDDRVEPFLRLFSDESVEVISKIMEAGPNAAKKVLANEVTRLVHGEAIAIECVRRAALVFEEGDLSEAPTTRLVYAQRTYADVLTETHMVKSRKDADRLASQGGIRLNGEPIPDVRDAAPAEVFVLGVGRKKIMRIDHR